MLVLSIDHTHARAATLATFGCGVSELQSSLWTDPTIRGFIVLATCARVEVYADASKFHSLHRAFGQSLALTSGLTTQEINTLTQVYRGPDALHHLFRVTAGLESAVVGELQVAGQVGAALAAARALGTTTRPLDIAFENSIRVSRLARGQLQEQPASIAGAGIDLALDGDAHGKVGVALVIGTGSFAKTCVGELRARGTHTVILHSPSGRPVKSGIAQQVIGAAELAPALARCDVVVAASGHGEIVVAEHHARDALSRRTTPLVVVDLAGAQDVSVALDVLPGVRVVRIGEVARRAAGEAASAALVKHEASTLYPRIEGREVDDVIVALREHVKSVVTAYPPGDPDLAEAIRRVTQALLHAPTLRARQAALCGDLENFRTALETVFGIDGISHSQPLREEGAA